MFVCGTILEIQLIPTKPVDRLLALGNSVRLKCATEDLFAPNSIDAALLSILAQGAKTPELGLLPIRKSALDRTSLTPALTTLRLPIGLRNMANEFPHHAHVHYGLPEDMEVPEVIIEAIRRGELDSWGEAGLDGDHLRPLNHHDEMIRREQVERAYEAHEALSDVAQHLAYASCHHFPPLCAA